jgi:hypothetical protein
MGKPVVHTGWLPAEPNNWAGCLATHGLAAWLRNTWGGGSMAMGGCSAERGPEVGYRRWGAHAAGRTAGKRVLWTGSRCSIGSRWSTYEEVDVGTQGRRHAAPWRGGTAQRSGVASLGRETVGDRARSGVWVCMRSKPLAGWDGPRANWV